MILTLTPATWNELAKLEATPQPILPYLDEFETFD
jgi:hypothetical protein